MAKEKIEVGSPHYVLIIVPSREVAAFVDQYRQKYAKYTDYVISSHITIYPPFCLEDTSEEQLKTMLKDGLLNAPSVKVCLNSVGFFEGKNNVAFFNPDDKSQEYFRGVLIKARDILKGHVRDIYEVRAPEKYHPHMTIAENIPDEKVPGIKEELKSQKIDLQFLVSSVQLFKKQQDSTAWEPIVNIKF